ncbi:MAG: hypothetical protein RL301_197 [Actinomycetota bacterium]
MIFLTVLAVVFLANVVPAFAPPTWTLLVLFTINYNVAPIPLVICGVIAATLGRWVLALYFRKFAAVLPKRWVSNMESAGQYFTANPDRKFGILTLFLVSPISSAQLFEAAGIMKNLKLRPLLLAFAAGRTISYSFYVLSARTLKETNFGEIIVNNLKSPIAIAAQIAMIVGLIALGNVKWRR